MYCKVCGQEIKENQYICLSCGTRVGEGNKFCANCGKEVLPDAMVCLNCGVALKSAGGTSNANWLPIGKDKITAIILCLFLGAIGVHNFYLGERKKGIAKILLCLVFGVSAIFALIDLIKMITDSYVVDPNKSF